MKKYSTQLVCSEGRFWLFMGSSAGLLLAAADLGVLHLFSEVIEAWKKPEGQVLTILFWLFGLGALRALGQFVARHSSTAAAEYIGADLRIRALSMMLCSKSDLNFTAGHVHHEINEIFPKASLYFRQLTTCLSVGLHLVILSSLLLYTALFEALVGVSGLVLVFVLVFWMHKKTALLATEIPDAHKRLTKGVNRVANNWMLIRMLRRGPDEHQVLAQDVRTYARDARKASFRIQLASIFPVILGLFVLCFCLYLGLRVWGQSGPTMLAFTYLFVRFVQASAQLASSWGAALALQTHVVRARDYLSQPFVPLEPSENTSNEVAVKAPEVRVDGLGFMYADGHRVLSAQTWSLKSGGCCVITGPSGSGKTTLLGLIGGLLEPNEGGIEIDGMPASQYMSSFRRSVAYVSAVPFLIEDSVRENLCYGLDEKPPDSALEDVLERVQLKERVMSSKLKLDRPVGDDGSPFSLGEQQRLCLARALVARPSLILLDEMTASLDFESQTAIVELLFDTERTSTVVWATHRRDLAKRSDIWIKL